jgi:branched-chain amino acid transport system ATP-binding protein
LSNRVLDIEGLSAGYDSCAVVRDLTLHVEAGEVVALIGPNGAGKTTTMLTISGFVEVLAGRIDVLGFPAPSLRRAHRLAGRGVVHVPEDRGLFLQLTAAENLELGAAGRAGIATAVEHFPELEPLLGRRAGLLSGGEQQMVALGRAIAARPRLVLIDELSFGLAPTIVERLLPAVRESAAAGAGVLLVEQRTDLALASADRAYLLNHGDLVAQGPAADLLADEKLVRGGYLGVEEVERR